jgi:cysteinyl-tRNA synthetase
MKKATLLLLMILSLNSVFSQQQRNYRDKIKALKTAHITSRLNLTSTEAEKFWPIYNASETKVQELKKAERKLKMRLSDDMEETAAAAILEEFVSLQNKMHEERTSLIYKLKKVMSPKKIIMLKKAEDDFNRKVLEQLKKRRNNNGPRKNKNTD